MRYTRTCSGWNTARNIRNIGKMADVSDGLINTGESISKRASWLSILKTCAHYPCHNQDYCYLQMLLSENSDHHGVVLPGRWSYSTPSLSDTASNIWRRIGGLPFCQDQHHKQQRRFEQRVSRETVNKRRSLIIEAQPTYCCKHYAKYN